MKASKTATSFVLAGLLLALLLVSTEIEASSRAKNLRLVRGLYEWNEHTLEAHDFIRFFIFNVTNPEEVVEIGAKPVLQQVGPYSYRQVRQKIALEPIACDNSTNTYEYETTYWFDEEGSGTNRESDVVNIFNAPFIHMMTSLIKMGMANTAWALASGFLSAEAFVRSRVRVEDVIFQGFPISGYNNSVIGPILTPEFEGNRYGIYRGRNGSVDGPYKIFTGAAGLDKVGIIRTWRGSSSLGVWGSAQCDEFSLMEATDGSMFSPLLEQSDSVSVFNSELCRSVKMEFEREVVANNQTAYRFLPRRGEFDGPEDNPSNQCYCFREDATECRNGVVDVSGCRNGSPFLLSKPHFLDGDDKLAGDMGLVPVRELHETTIDIDPITGLLVGAKKRIQTNIELIYAESSFGPIAQYEHITEDMVLPVLWAEEVIDRLETRA